MKSNDFESLYRRAGAYCARRETCRGDLEKKFRPVPAANAHPPSENTHRLTDRPRLSFGQHRFPIGKRPRPVRSPPGSPPPRASYRALRPPRTRFRPTPIGCGAVFRVKITDLTSSPPPIFGIKA